MGIHLKVGITGLPASGKTFALLKVISMLEEEGTRVGGLVCEPIYDDQLGRVGFEAVNWATKERGLLAHTKIRTPLCINEFFVDREVLEGICARSVEEAVENADIVVIDEVGRIQVESERFIAAVKTALESKKPMIITLHKKSRNPLLQDIRRRDDVRILEVTPINRNLLPYKILKLISEELGI